MGITNKPVYINIARPSMYAVLYAKQSDVNRAFTAVFNNDGEAWSIPENAVVSIWYRGAAGEGNYTKGIEINGNTAVVPLIPQMLSVPGTGLLCIIINTAAGDQIGTWNIPYFVEEIPGGNSEAATEFYTAFSEIASEVAAYALEAKESARAAAASANEVSGTVSINPQALTEEQQTQARANIGAIGAAEIGEMSGAVSYAAQQNLSEGQQAQARENIGAASEKAVTAAQTAADGKLPLSGGDMTGWVNFGQETRGITWKTADGTEFSLRPHAEGNVFQVTRKTPGGEWGTLNIYTNGKVEVEGINDGAERVHNIMVVPAGTDVGSLSLSAGTIVMVRK